MAANGKPKKLNLAREHLVLTGTAEALRRSANKCVEPSSPKPLRKFAQSMASALAVRRDRLALVKSIVMGTSNAAAIISLANKADDYEEGSGHRRRTVSRRDYSNAAKPSGAASRTG